MIFRHIIYTIQKCLGCFFLTPFLQYYIKLHFKRRHLSPKKSSVDAYNLHRTLLYCHTINAFTLCNNFMFMQKKVILRRYNNLNFPPFFRAILAAHRCVSKANIVEECSFVEEHQPTVVINLLHNRFIL